LVHLVDDAKLDKQEIESGTFSGNSSVDFSKNVNLFLGLESNFLLFFDFNSSLLCVLKLLDKSKVLKNG